MSDHRPSCTCTKLPQYLGSKIGPWENTANYFLITKLFINSIVQEEIKMNDMQVGKYKIRKISWDEGST